MNVNILPCPGLISPRPSRLTNALIMIHGLGDSEKFLSLGISFNLPETIVVAPRAPFDVPLIENAYMWTKSLDDNSVEAFTTSIELVGQIIRNLIDLGVEARRITIFGNGQGGSLSLLLAMRYGTNVISIGGPSPFFPPFSDSPDVSTPKGGRCLICGGDSESSIPLDLSHLHPHFKDLRRLTWRQSGDGIPSPKKHNSWFPIIEWLSKTIVQMKGIPEGAIQV